MRKYFIYLIPFVAGLTTSVCAANMDRNLVARWTFSGGSLKSDVGNLEFIEGGRGTIEKGNGAVKLLDRKFLSCPKLTSAAVPDLKKSITIWARVKFDELPTEGDLGVLGLQANSEPGTWPSIVFSLLCRVIPDDLSRSGVAFLARPQNTAEIGVGVQRYLPVVAGEFVDVAIVFNGQTGTAGMWTSSSGQWVESKLSGADSLQDFGGFLIGHVMMPGASSPITFDEVRIYSSALESQWLAEIKAKKSL